MSEVAPTNEEGAHPRFRRCEGGVGNTSGALRILPTMLHASATLLPAPRVLPCVLQHGKSVMRGPCGTRFEEGPTEETLKSVSRMAGRT